RVRDETALEEMTRAAVLVARVEGIGRQQSLHEGRKVGARRADKDVKMVIHKDIGVEHDGRKVQVVGQLGEETLAVVAPENLRPAVAAASNMIHSVGEIDTW